MSMKKYLVTIPIAGYIDVVIEDDGKASDDIIFENAIKVYIEKVKAGNRSKGLHFNMYQSLHHLKHIKWDYVELDTDCEKE